MKIISVFILLIYWSIMISAPIMGKNSIEEKNLKVVSSF
tara:strand:- start:304 stop:420 length:117 start_codon:yes stop_codon:yes gene_type:complete